jgi:hypothetical protein
MQPLSRRGVALLATAATLGAGSLSTASLAFGAPSSVGSTVNSERLTLVDPVASVLGLLTGATSPALLQTLLSTLGVTSNSQLGSLLGQADPAQLNALLAGLTPTQLTGAVDGLATSGQLNGFLDTLSAGQLGDVLAPLTGGQLGSTLGLLDVDQIRNSLGTLTPTELSSVVDGLSPAQTGALLGTSNLGELNKWIAALTPAQLNGALPALSGTPLAGVLALLDPAQLTSAVGVLSPAQITSLLSDPTSATAVVTGLAGKATSLSGAPDVPGINGLLAQVQALLGGGLPTVPGTDGLLSTITSLLNVPGLDTALVTSLLSTLQTAVGTAAPGVDTTPLQTVIGTLQGVLGATPAGSPTTKPAATAKPATTTKPATSTAARPVQAGFTAYRAIVRSIKVAKNRRSARVTVSCPAAAPKGCLVTLDGLVAGKKAFASKTVVVMRNITKTVTVKLTSVAGNRLKKSGGALKVTAATAFSTLSSVNKTVKVAKPLKKIARTR